jgi:hypothetical protein
MQHLLSIPFGWIAWFGFVIVFGLFALGVINFDFLKKKKTQQPIDEPTTEPTLTPVVEEEPVIDVPKTEVKSKKKPAKKVKKQA